MKKVDEDGGAERLATSQGFRHRYVLDQAFIRLGTTNEFVILVKQEGLMFPLPKTRLSSTSKMEDKGVVV
ncbi:hypothetical protein ACFX2A_031481 [Malus domestica]